MDVPCPTCRTRTPWGDNPWRPFCSERCRLLDLGRWLREDYTVPVVDDASDEESEEHPDR